MQDYNIALRDDRLFVESVDKAMRVLLAFRSDAPMTVAEVARVTGIGRSAAQRFIHTWLVMNYICKDPDEKGYILTPKVLNASYNFYKSHYVLERAHPYLVEAGKRAQERVGFGEIDGTDYVLLFQTPSPRSSDPFNLAGTRYPAYLSTSGLAIMAHMPEAEARAILSRSDLIARTAHTPTTQSEILKLLEEVRDKGYCITQEFYDYGRISVSVPVFSGTKDVIGAVNISSLLVRHKRESVESELMPVAFETAQTISAIFNKR